MLEVIKEQTALNALFNRGRKRVIDNFVSVLYYRLTTAILATATVLLGTRQYFGDPITCACDGVAEHILEPYCWAKGTFTVEELTVDSILPEVAHPGVGFYDPRVHRKVHHTYYQWVPLVLMLMASVIYAPRLCWKFVERHTMERLAPQDGEGRVSWTARVLNYVMMNRYRIWRYSMTYIIFDVINPLLVILLTYLLNLLFNGKFLLYGYNFIMYHGNMDNGLINPFELTFPKATSCLYRSHGPGGDVQDLPALCILPLNVLNEKIFLVLWFWFAILLTLSGMQTLLRLASFLLPPIRLYLLCVRPHLDYQGSVIIRGVGFTTIIFLKQIGKNAKNCDHYDFLIEAFSHFIQRHTSLQFGDLVLIDTNHPRLKKCWVDANSARTFCHRGVGTRAEDDDDDDDDVTKLKSSLPNNFSQQFIRHSDIPIEFQTFETNRYCV